MLHERLQDIELQPGSPWGGARRSMKTVHQRKEIHTSLMYSCFMWDGCVVAAYAAEREREREIKMQEKMGSNLIFFLGVWKHSRIGTRMKPWVVDLQTAHAGFRSCRCAVCSRVLPKSIYIGGRYSCHNSGVSQK